jgi:monovalent cation:H+ antiporter, CPA1 family
MESHHFLEIIIGLCLTLTIASTLFAVSKKLRVVPFTFLLFLTGIVLSMLPIHTFDVIRLTPATVLYVFLPILLFESAYNFEFHNFRKILTPGFWLATVGLLISAVIVAAGLNGFLDIPFMEALLYGCVISSTDPIAVLTIFKQLGVPRKLQLLVDGESFLNDGTSVIAFRIILTLVGGAGASAGFGAAELGSSFVNFLVVLFGGALVGISLGYVATKIIKQLQDMAPVELTITVIMAHAAFILADHYLKVSGIIAVLGAGIVLGNYGHDHLSKKAQADMHVIWDYLVFLTVSLVFFLIGYEMDLARLWENRNAVALATGALLIGRAVSVYSIGGLYNLTVKKSKRLPLNWLHVANWGGLRGVLPLVVILSLPENFPNRELFVDMVLGAILFTLTVNALSIPALIKWLGVANDSDKTSKGDVHKHKPFRRLFHLKSILQEAKSRP